MAVRTVEVPAKFTFEDDVLTEITVNGLPWAGQAYVPIPTTIPSTIAIGEALASTIDLAVSATRSVRPCAVLVDNWDEADMTFQASANGSQWFDVFGMDGSELRIEIAAERIALLTPADFLGFRYLRPRSGTTAAPVDQTAAVTITLFCAQ